MRALQGSRSATSPYIDPAVAVGNKTGARARYPRNLTLSLPFQSPKTFLRSGVAQLDLSTDRGERFSPVKKTVSRFRRAPLFLT